MHYNGRGMWTPPPLVNLHALILTTYRSVVALGSRGSAAQCRLFQTTIAFGAYQAEE